MNILKILTLIQKGVCECMKLVREKEYKCRLTVCPLASKNFLTTKTALWLAGLAVTSGSVR